MEHTLQLLCKLVATLHLELCEHATFSVVGNRTPVKQPFRKVPLVIPLKDVLIRKEAEYGNRLVEDGVHFRIGFL